jgi:hypothetical protein
VGIEQPCCCLGPPESAADRRASSSGLAQGSEEHHWIDPDRARDGDELDDVERTGRVGTVPVRESDCMRSLGRFGVHNAGARLNTNDRVDRTLDRGPQSGNLCLSSRIGLHFAHACTCGK